MKKKIALLVILSLAVLYNLTLLYIDANIKNRVEKHVYENCNKIWSARGFYNSREEQNTITSMKRAFELGAIGAEVDLYYDVKMDKFIISHDKPKKGIDGNLVYTKKGGELLTLEKFLKVLSKDHYFWLDYKNLDRLSVDETSKAIQKLSEITNFDSIKERLYIEGSNPLKLSLYNDAGFKTILGIHPLPQTNLLSSIVLNGYKIAYYFTNTTALAMPYGSLEKPIYGDDAQISLKDIPVFLFHVPDDKKLLQSLVEKRDIKALLAGRDKSLNRFSINMCE